jgi:SAM-dependent MidA family methyltransferase
MLRSMQPWSAAWEEALYGPSGFFVRERPAAHFRTSVTTSRAYAHAVRVLAGRVDDALGRPDPYDVVDLGAGRGELLHALPDVPARWRLTAVERAPDPGTQVRWLARLPSVTGLLVANEWLDAVPLDLVDDGRLVLVDRAGRQRPGPPAPAEALAWCARWWPCALGGQGRPAEVGVSRDRAWAAAVASVARGLAVAADYGHTRATRRPTLTGYRDGRQVPPVPDGSCDVTAHVALDSCAAATGARLLTQRAALADLGVDAALPVWEGDAPAYAAGLQRASDAAELLDPAGLGGFGWLVQEVGLPGVLPAAG